ncbi:MAG: hypothetical protein D4S02_17145 [Rhodocyclaceae bacterium]|nr:MAG: hypothetical protein D4S02_17145 [Rhodocyclaceae bacterium]
MTNLNAIGASSFPTDSVAGGSGVALEGQLARYQVQLADWVNCPSCTTREGKAKIQELSDKVHDVQQRINAAENQRQRVEGSQVETAQYSLETRPAARPVNAIGAIEGFLNVYA